MSSWWAAQKILKVALRAPLQSRRGNGFVFTIFVLPFLLVLAGLKALMLGLFDRNLGTVFFDPDGAIDPVFVQHLFWLLGAPETPLVLAILFFPFVIWAQAVWFQAQSGRVSLKVGWGHLGRIFAVYATAFLLVLMIGILSLVIELALLLAVPVALFILFRFASVMSATTAGDTASWRSNHVASAVLVWCVVDFIVVILLLGIPAGVFEMIVRTALLEPGGTSYGAFQIHVFLAFLARCLAWIYGLYVLTAMVAGIANKGVAAQASLFR